MLNLREVFSLVEVVVADVMAAVSVRVRDEWTDSFCGRNTQYLKIKCGIEQVECGRAGIDRCEIH